ncbi:MAG: hypothetical protein IKE51_02745 [Solobacterium sp.]|nr:hypothetical protein [Solobacterium sp.]
MEEIKITGTTKAIELLKNYPFLVDEIKKKGAAFAIVANPLTQRMFKNYTIQDICTKFNLNQEEVIKQLTDMIKKHKA